MLNGWILKARYSELLGLYMGRWWHDEKGVPQLHEDGYTAKMMAKLSVQYKMNNAGD